MPGVADVIPDGQLSADVCCQLHSRNLTNVHLLPLTNDYPREKSRMMNARFPSRSGRQVVLNIIHSFAICQQLPSKFSVPLELRPLRKKCRCRRSSTRYLVGDDKEDSGVFVTASKPGF